MRVREINLGRSEEAEHSEESFEGVYLVRSSDLIKPQCMKPGRGLAQATRHCSRDGSTDNIESVGARKGLQRHLMSGWDDDL